MSTRFQAPFNRAVESNDKIRNDLLLLDILILGTPVSHREKHWKAIAASYVWLSATLEEFVKTSLEICIEELNLLALNTNQVRPSLLALLGNSAFDSLQQVRGLKMWAKRSTLLELTGASILAEFNPSILPIDGRTIRPEHFNVLWSIFGFHGNSIPGPFHSLALNDLAEGRNNVAHGEVSPIDFGRRKHIPDVLKIIDRIDDIYLHYSLTNSNYFSNREYLR